MTQAYATRTWVDDRKGSRQTLTIGELAVRGLISEAYLDDLRAETRGPPDDAKTAHRAEQARLLKKTRTPAGLASNARKPFVRLVSEDGVTSA